MNEISELLQQKAGLTPEQAQVVEQLIAQHLMARVPAEFQGILGSFIGGGAGAAAPAGGGLGALLSEATSLFGHKE